MRDDHVLFTVEMLYSEPPDKLFLAKNKETWYAFYDSALSILTNVNDILEVYSYVSKPEYRSVRTTIVETYDVRRIRVIYPDDEF